MKDLKALYTQRIAQFSQEEQRLQKKRNLITLSKVICFSTAIYTLWELTIAPAEYRLWVIMGFILTILIYLFLAILDSKIFRKITRLAALIRCNQTESNYLNGNYSTLVTGEEFFNPAHPYAHDLDLFGEHSLFQELNRTVTWNGKQKLAEMLQNNCKDPDEIKQRQEAAGELANELDFCHEFRAAGMENRVEELNNEVISKWFAKESFFKSPFLMPIVWILNTAMIAVVPAVVFFNLNIGYFAILFLIQLSIAMYRAYYINVFSAELSTFIKALSNYIYLADNIIDKSFESTKLKAIHAGLFKEKDAVRALKKLKRVEGALDSRINLILLVTLNGLYARDLHTIFRLERWKKEYLSRVPEWIQSLSLLDVYVSMANYRFNHPEFTVPHICRETPVNPSGHQPNLLSTKEMGHPLLHGEQVVTNDFHLSNLHHFYIITGANMAGKSTFLRSVGVNLVLAMSGNPVFAAEFTFSPITLFTSMRTTDNLSKGTSYFHAELLRLKELVDSAAKEPLFIILDEMLKGTNSQDKLNGSIRFLEKLLTLPVCGIIATHDLALGELKDCYPIHFQNRCFEIEHTANDIQYDYRLKEGVSRNMNASILLQKMGLTI